MGTHKGKRRHSLYNAAVGPGRSYIPGSATTFDVNSVEGPRVSDDAGEVSFDCPTDTSVEAACISDLCELCLIRSKNVLYRAYKHLVFGAMKFSACIELNEVR